MLNKMDMKTFSIKANHFLPRGGAYTTGLSHNPFTWRPGRGGVNAKKVVLARKSHTTLQNKVRIKVVPVQLTLF